ncbi:MAG: hypothetical protein V1244_03920, partial [Nitrospinaceae bacterium]|nr:hypothetical protein [Nitrospinaceae bacterium]
MSATTIAGMLHKFDWLIAASRSEIEYYSAKSYNKNSGEPDSIREYIPSRLCIYFSELFFYSGLFHS